MASIFRWALKLGALAEVAGAALPPHLALLFPPLLSAMGSADAEESGAAANAAAAVLRSVPGEAGGYWEQALFRR